MPGGETKQLALEIVKNGISDYISPRKIRLTTLSRR